MTGRTKSLRMIYRHALESDSDQIALLHAQSWRMTYRGLFNEDFLDNQADADRQRAWSARLAVTRPQQFVYVADDGGKIAGFVCAYGHDNPDWGSLIDNLHVATGYQRRGIGTQLMQHTFSWLQAHYPDDGIYLWVMARNTPAQAFYQKLGAVDAGEVDKPNPVGGGSALNRRYVWPKQSF